MGVKRFITLMIGILALVVGAVAAAWMNSLLFALADSSSTWERVANVVWLPGRVASSITGRNLDAKGVLVFYTLVFATALFTGAQLVRKSSTRRKAGTLVEK